MLVAVNFHYIRPNFDHPYPGIHGISPEQFASQLKLLRRAGRFISGPELRTAVEGGKPLAAPSLIVTFDDGLREQFDHAWPILQELAIPAIFFINTHPIASGTLSAVHKIHLVRAHLEPEKFEKRLRHKAAERGLSLSAGADPTAASKHYVYDTPVAAQLKFLLNFSLPPTERDAIVAEIFDEVFPGRETVMSRQLYMTPEQIAELGRHGAIGSHAHDHLPLGLQSPSAIETQISLANHYLSDWTGDAPYALSYPYGSREACSPAAASVARRLGIRFAFTMERAANPDLSRPLHLARFDNNDVPGGKSARFAIDDLFEGLPSPKWFEALARRRRFRRLGPYSDLSRRYSYAQHRLLILDRPPPPHSPHASRRMMLPFNAVIQGPLSSPPTVGRRWPANLNPDCVPSVLSSASAITEQNGIAVVSTWAGEDVSQCERIAADAAVADLVETPDPGKPPDTNGPVGDNRMRQALSTWRGLEELERRGAVGLVAKIRTDQTIPVPLVRRFASDFLAGLDESARDTAVFITSAHAISLYEIDDFVFVGTLPAMKRFFEAQIRLAAFHSGTHSIHGDLVRKHLCWTVGPALGWPAWRAFPALPFHLPATARPRIHPEVIEPWVRTLLDFLIPMPVEVWMQMTWRGSPPFAEWADWSGLSQGDRLWFEDRDAIIRQREDFFLRKWPDLFSAKGSLSLQRSLDYALEVPHEMKRGQATRGSVFFRRARRLINRRRFRIV